MAKYEMVIGLEVHAELKTASKIFCGCATKFDAEPNTQCCPVCMGLPGALPVLNKKVVELAVKAGMATNCSIARASRQDRKNYFYPDLPKAYQISQFDLPLCEHGLIELDCANAVSGEKKKIGITRIHIEEDAGKLVHMPSGDTLIDLNRCGVPLIEIVSDPDIRSEEEAREYLLRLRAILIAADISDCKMEEGSLRCDVNLSVRHAGDDMGTRTEMKNLNSFANVVKAIESEYERQVSVLEEGGQIEQQTRRFDPASGKTIAMRSKENADDYRYFPDPDLPPIELSEAWIARMHAGLPELPDALKARLKENYGLSEREAGLLSSAPRLCRAFERAWKQSDARKALRGLVVSYLSRAEDDASPDPDSLSQIAVMIDRGEIHAGGAAKALQEHLRTGDAPDAIVERLGLRQISDRAQLDAVAKKAIQENEALVKSFLSGRENAMKGLMGAIMRMTGGRANPSMAEAQLRERLKR